MMGRCDENGASDHERVNSTTKKRSLQQHRASLLLTSFTAPSLQPPAPRTDLLPAVVVGGVGLEESLEVAVGRGGPRGCERDGEHCDEPQHELRHVEEEARGGVEGDAHCKDEAERGGRGEGRWDERRGELAILMCLHSL